MSRIEGSQMRSERKDGAIPSGMGRGVAGLILGAVLFLVGCGAGSGPGVEGPSPATASDPPPEAEYWIYVGSESADRLHRVRFGPAGIEVERSTVVGRLPTEVEGPHGVVVSHDARYVYLTTGHGVPDGHFWKFEVGPDSLVAEPILLGRFPATMDLTSDGLYAFVVNFNLYGSMVPSTMSVVYTPDVVEVAQIEMCTMPHGVRAHPGGIHVYSVCMMDDQLVEVDTHTFRVSRRFSVDVGNEGPLPADAVAMDHGEGHGAGRDHGAHAAHEDHAAGEDPEGVSPMTGAMERARHHASCSPTWAVPSTDGSRLWVACNVADQILEVDVEDWSLVRRIPTGRGPYNLEPTPDGRLLVATLKQGNAVEFFDTATGESLAVTPTSTTVVHGVTISPDSRYAFVSVEGVGSEPGKVDVFDLGSFRMVASVAVGQQAAGIDFLRMEPSPSR
jgi:DNA-binding beta-propeller fold protein YncE